MKILSIDLASKDYRDFGWALLEVGSQEPTFLTADHFGLQNPPHAQDCANAIHQFCEREDVRILLLDGPQGWRHPASPIAHMRLCERVLNTPGKTGAPGFVKPRTYLHYMKFSIDLFQQLRHSGWCLLHEAHIKKPPELLVIESFPSYAWRTLGLVKLPAKGRIKATETEPFRTALAQVSGYGLPKGLTHDELQAAVVLPVGEALASRSLESLVLAGIDPIIEDGIVYEGWIPLPRRY